VKRWRASGRSIRRRLPKKRWCWIHTQRNWEKRRSLRSSHFCQASTSWTYLNSELASGMSTCLSVCLYVSVYLHVYTSVCLPAFLSFRLSMFLCYPSVCLSASISVCLSISICMSICRYVYLSVCLSVCMSGWMSVCLSVYLSVCLSVFRYVFLCVSACRYVWIFLDESNPSHGHLSAAPSTWWVGCLFQSLHWPPCGQGQKRHGHRLHGSVHRKKPGGEQSLWQRRLQAGWRHETRIASGKV